MCSERSNARVAAKQSAGVMSKSIEEHAILILRIYDPTSQRSQSANLLVLLDSNLHMHVLNMLYESRPSQCVEATFHQLPQGLSRMHCAESASPRRQESQGFWNHEDATVSPSTHWKWIGLPFALPTSLAFLAFYACAFPPSFVTSCDHMYVQIEEKT